MATHQDLALSRTSLRGQFYNLILIGFGFILFIFSAYEYKYESWFPILLSFRVMSVVTAFLLALLIYRKILKYPSVDTFFFSLVLVFQATLGILEGPTKNDFYSYTGILFLIASLSTRISIKLWLKYFSLIQIGCLLVPLLFKDKANFTSIGVFVNSYSLPLAGFILGIIILRLNSTKYEAMQENITLTRALLEEKERAFLAQKQMTEKIDKELQLAKMKIETTSRLSATLEIAQQVSHDIRSPLSALTMITSTLTQIPEEKRLIVRNAVNRINDIANTLIEQAKQSKARGLMQTSDDQQTNQGRDLYGLGIQNSGFTPALETELIPALIDNLVSEKRVQFREKINIEIEEDLRDSYGSFAEINATDFKRVLSNLINNSIEAFPDERGTVLISVRGHQDHLLISIKDNGKGIPLSIIERIGEEGVSFGKEGTSSGSGLGMFHAKKIIHSFKGKLQIQSKENEGTLISIILPRAKSPNWFVNKLSLIQGHLIAVLDDDYSIHQIWQERIKSLAGYKSNNLDKPDQVQNENDISILGFTSSKEFRKRFERSSQKADLYLVDYELLGQNETGLDVIESLQLGNHAILVTSRYEEQQIKERCRKLDVKLIPKTMAPFVPITISAPKLKYDWVLIDDDPLIHITWEFAAKEKNLNTKSFFKPSDFFNLMNEIDSNTPIYIDSQLGFDEVGQPIKGKAVAQEIFKNGFHEIYIATGRGADEFKSEPYIKGIVGKEPPGSLKS